MTQAVWSTAHGDLLSVTDVHGEQISRLGAHFDPILVAFAPLWWLWPDPELLLVLQAVAVASGALPVLPAGAKAPGLGLARRGLACAYLLYPPVQWLTVSDFHPVALACPLLLYAWWHLDEGGSGPSLSSPRPRSRPRSTSVSRSRRWASGTPSAIGPCDRSPRSRSPGADGALAAALVVVPHFAPAGSSAFESRYDSPALDPRDLAYLAQLLFPLLFLPLAAPLAALAAVPELGLNLLSSTVTQTSVRTHYAAVATPALLAAAVFGAARLGRRLAYSPLVAAAAGTILLGPLGRIDVSRGPTRRRGQTGGSADPCGRSP